MDNLEKDIREKGELYCSACHRIIDEYDYEYIDDVKHFQHEDITLKEDGEYYCSCNVCEEPDSLLIPKADVIERQKLMLKLVTRVLDKIQSTERP